MKTIHIKIFVSNAVHYCLDQRAIRYTDAGTAIPQGYNEISIDVSSKTGVWYFGLCSRYNVGVDLLYSLEFSN